MADFPYSHALIRHSGGGANVDTVTTDGPVTEVGDLIIIVAMRSKDPEGEDFPQAAVAGFDHEYHIDPSEAGAGVIDVLTKYADSTDVTGFAKSYSVNWGHTAPYGKIIGIAMIKGRLRPISESSDVYDDRMIFGGASPTSSWFLYVATSDEGHDLTDYFPHNSIPMGFTTSGVVRNAGWASADESGIPDGFDIFDGFTSTGTIATIEFPSGIAPTGDITTDAGIASATVDTQDARGIEGQDLDQNLGSIGQFRPREGLAPTLGQVLRRIEAVERRASVSTYQQSYTLSKTDDQVVIDTAVGVYESVYSTFFSLGPPTSTLSIRVPVFVERPDEEIEVYLRWRDTSERTVSFKAQAAMSATSGLQTVNDLAIFHWKFFTNSPSHLDVMVGRSEVSALTFFDETAVRPPTGVVMHTTLPTATINGVHGYANFEDQTQVFSVDGEPLDPNVP